jgi:peptidoglycan/xylan/chitin deacetylase (PgdA/CDA1 family)
MTKITSSCNEYNWKSTFFIQGDLIEILAQEIKNIESDHEIGLHGYHHELWGKPIWFGDMQEQTPQVKKEELLVKSIKAFERIDVKRPLSFRAPWLIIDEDTLDLLRSYNFLIDSSVFSPRYGNPTSFYDNKLLRIPVSASPIPRIVSHFKIPVFLPYKVLNLRTILLEPIDSLITIIREIITYQRIQGTVQHIVILAHPWEFFEQSGRCVTTHGDAFDLFTNRLLYIQKVFNITWIPLQNIQSIMN